MVTVPSKYGIKDLREALALGLTLIGAGSNLVRKNRLAAMAQLSKAGGLIAPAVENGKDIPNQYKDIDAAEMEVLVADVKTELPNIVPEKAILLVDIAITTVLNIVKGVHQYNEASKK
jgi:hypothetical protein